MIGVLLAAAPAWSAGEYAYREEAKPTGGEMMWDTFAMRPFGMLATAVGAVVYVVSYPFAYLGGNTEESKEALVTDPYEWTFERPLGQF
jgi:hypothetical protein